MLQTNSKRLLKRELPIVWRDSFRICAYFPGAHVCLLGVCVRMTVCLWRHNLTGGGFKKAPARRRCQAKIFGQFYSASFFNFLSDTISSLLHRQNFSLNTATRLVTPLYIPSSARLLPSAYTVVAENVHHLNYDDLHQNDDFISRTATRVLVAGDVHKEKHDGQHR